MKIAVSSDGLGLESKVSDVFGRCPFLVFVDIENKKIGNMASAENSNCGQSTGAGIAVAQLVAENGAEAVISGTFGPRAMDVLNQFGIKAFKGKGTVKEALQALMEGRLEKAEGSK